jgi:hypothetical protein
VVCAHKLSQLATHWDYWLAVKLSGFNDEIVPIILAKLEALYGLHSSTSCSSLSQIFKNHHLPSRRSVKLILCVIIPLKTSFGIFVSVSGYISISRVRTLWTERLRIKIVTVFSTSPALCLSSSHRHCIFYMRNWKSSVLWTTDPRAVHAQSVPLCHVSPRQA